MAAQAPAVHVDGIWGSMFSVVLTGARHRRVLARTLCARDAGPLLELAGLQVAGASLLVLPAAGPIRRMAEAANVLLPTLRDKPTSAVILGLVEASAVKLREHARAAGGGFHRESVLLVDRLAAFVAEARAMPPHAPHGGLRERVDDLQHTVKALLDAKCTLRLEEPAAGGA